MPSHFIQWGRKNIPLFDISSKLTFLFLRLTAPLRDFSSVFLRTIQSSTRHSSRLQTITYIDNRIPWLAYAIWGIPTTKACPQPNQLLASVVSPSFPLFYPDSEVNTTKLSPSPKQACLCNNGLCRGTLMDWFPASYPPPSSSSSFNPPTASGHAIPAA